uniref:Malate dehydrogenase n=1 Tax=Timema douglasi TaxID=61478 RepID=A0A7R8ZA23_TIMDO|nr:unnamed protein product [Timema douglasi]
MAAGQMAVLRALENRWAGQISPAGREFATLPYDPIRPPKLVLIISNLTFAFSSDCCSLIRRRPLNFTARRLRCWQDGSCELSVSTKEAMRLLYECLSTNKLLRDFSPRHPIPILLAAHARLPPINKVPTLTMSSVLGGAMFKIQEYTLVNAPTAFSAAKRGTNKTHGSGRFRSAGSAASVTKPSSSQIGRGSVHWRDSSTTYRNLPICCRADCPRGTLATLSAAVDNQLLNRWDTRSIACTHGMHSTHLKRTHDDYETGPLHSGLDMYLNAALQILKQSMSRKSPLFSLIGRSPSLVSSCKLGTRSQGDDPPNRHSPEGVSSGRASTSQSDPDDKATEPQRVVPLMEARRFFVDVLTSSSVNDNYAQQMADALLFADYNGIYSHGLSRLGFGTSLLAFSMCCVLTVHAGMYVNDLESGAMDGNACPVLLRESPSTGWVDGQNGPGVVIGNFCMQLAIQKAKEEGVGLVSAKQMYVRDAQTGKCDVNVKPCVLKDTVSTAWVEGNNGLGMVVGNFCMKLAIAKAKHTGVGWVVAKGSNHYGIASWYSTQALKKCMLGLTFTDTSPLVCPTRSKKAALGTNPLSLAAPALKRDSFILDMATSAVAVGKIEVKMKAQQSIPEGWAQDAEGNITTDASVAFKASHLMPLGGSEETSGYKGYGLAMLVETLCGVLAGENFIFWVSAAHYLFGLRSNFIIKIVC